VLRGAAVALLALALAGCSLADLTGGPEPVSPDEAEAHDDAIDALVDRTLPEIAGPSRKSHIEPRLGEAAIALIGFAPEVRCWSTRDWEEIDTAMGFEGLYGFADAFTLRLHLAPEVCGPLAEAMYRGRLVRDVEMATALVVFVHEAQHFTGGRPSEAAVECRAMQRAGRAAELLFDSEAYGSDLARIYWERVYPYQVEGYVTDDCRDGGPLDLEAGREGWPVP
jgi:hypothetical protein